MEVRAIGSATRHIAKAGLVTVIASGEDQDQGLTEKKKLRSWEAVVGTNE